MSPSSNKRTVERYIAGFNASDHPGILDCLTEDVVWEMPGAFRLVGKAAFDGEIENPAFSGPPVVTVTRMIEEGDVVVAEGRVLGHRRDGGSFEAAFCDVFEMRDGLIARLIGYLTMLG